LRRRVQGFFGGGVGGSASSGSMSPPLTFSSTSMEFSSRVVGAGPVVVCGLAGDLANACGTVRADMNGAGNMRPLSIASILRPGTGPSACRVRTVTSA
jgi:hypothetical protein